MLDVPLVSKLLNLARLIYEGSLVVQVGLHPLKHGRRCRRARSYHQVQCHGQIVRLHLSSCLSVSGGLSHMLLLLFSIIGVAAASQHIA
jgi:ribosomal protein L2